MAARSSKRVSGAFYKQALEDASAAEFLKNRPATKRGPFYEVEIVLSAE